MLYSSINPGMLTGGPIHWQRKQFEYCLLRMNKFEYFFLRKSQHKRRDFMRYFSVGYTYILAYFSTDNYRTVIFGDEQFQWVFIWFCEQVSEKLYTMFLLSFKMFGTVIAYETLQQNMRHIRRTELAFPRKKFTIIVNDLFQLARILQIVTFQLLSKGSKCFGNFFFFHKMAKNKNKNFFGMPIPRYYNSGSEENMNWSKET